MCVLVYFCAFVIDDAAVYLCIGEIVNFLFHFCLLQQEYLAKMVEKYGEGSWARIAKELGKKGYKRTGPQCGKCRIESLCNIINFSFVLRYLFIKMNCIYLSLFYLPLSL